jgi:excisionase family DNA binding protein
MAGRRTARGIHGRLFYTPAEAASVLGLCKATIRRWIATGMPADKSRRPTLILGADLKAFLLQRQQRRKHACQLHQLFCMACRMPRAPAGALVEIASESDATLNLRARCEVCDAVMHKRIARRDLSTLQARIVLRTTQRAPSLTDT